MVTPSLKLMIEDALNFGVTDTYPGDPSSIRNCIEHIYSILRINDNEKVEVNNIILNWYNR